MKFTANGCCWLFRETGFYFWGVTLLPYFSLGKNKAGAINKTILPAHDDVFIFPSFFPAIRKKPFSNAIITLYSSVIVLPRIIFTYYHNQPPKLEYPVLITIPRIFNSQFSIVNSEMFDLFNFIGLKVTHHIFLKINVTSKKCTQVLIFETA